MSRRPRCTRCERPLAACLCHAIRPEAPNVVVGVLQHPREAQAAKSTGSLLPLAFTNAFRLVGVELGEALDEHLSGFPQGTVGVLFPEDARPIAESPPLRCLLVPDGSWSQARCILGANPCLEALPRHALPGGLEGDFPIRKPQGLGRISTLEAAVAALRALSGDPHAHQAALDLQQALVDQWTARLRAGGARHPALGTSRWSGRRGP